jgi:hypothetical protein
MKLFRRIAHLFRSFRLWLVLLEFFPYLPIKKVINTMDLNQLRTEFETFIAKDHEASVAENAAAVAETELANVTSTETAAVAIRQSEADQAIATSTAAFDTAEQTAVSARELAQRQKYHLAGLLGITPPTDDPTP